MFISQVSEDKRFVSEDSEYQEKMFLRNYFKTQYRLYYIFLIVKKYISLFRNVFH